VVDHGSPCHMVGGGIDLNAGSRPTTHHSLDDGGNHWNTERTIVEERTGRKRFGDKTWEKWHPETTHGKRSRRKKEPSESVA